MSKSTWLSGERETQHLQAVEESIGMLYITHDNAVPDEFLILF